MGYVLRLTAEDARIRSQASLYSTVGEFLANSSVASAYANTAERPAPTRMTVKLAVLAVDRRTQEATAIFS